MHQTLCGFSQRLCSCPPLAASPLRASDRVKTDGLLFKAFTGSRLVGGPHVGEEDLPGSRTNKSPGCYPGDPFLPCLPPATPCTETCICRWGRAGGELCGAAARMLRKEGLMDGTCLGRKREVRLDFEWHERECVFSRLNNMEQDTEEDEEVTVPGTKGDPPTPEFRC